MKYFPYGKKEVEYLKSRDKRLSFAIDKIGHIDREVDTDLFASVIHHILGQQISTVAQKTIWERFIKKVGKVNAKNILSQKRKDLQSIGTTYKKVDYIIDFAKKVDTGVFDIKKLYKMTDEEVIKSLSSLKGIGQWTAEMIMIFSMKRKNIVSFKDLAIIRGMKMLYHKDNIDRKTFDKYCKIYSPYGTVASLYLWAVSRWT